MQCGNAIFHEDKGCCNNKKFIGMYGCWCGDIRNKDCNCWEAIAGS